MIYLNFIGKLFHRYEYIEYFCRKIYIVKVSDRLLITLVGKTTKAGYNPNRSLNIFIYLCM